MTLTPAEQAAVDRYPEELIQRIPRGVSAFDYTKPMSWKTQSQRTMQLRDAQAARAAAQRKAAVALLQKLLDRGLTNAQMARALGVTASTISKRLAYYKMRRDPSQLTSKQVAHRRKLAHLRQCYDAGMQLTAAARLIGCSYRMAKTYSAEIGLLWRVHPNGRKRDG